MTDEPLNPKALPKKDEERRRLAFEKRDRAYAAMQRNEPLVASLLVADATLLAPNDPEMLQSFDRIVGSQRDPLALFPVATGAIHVATAAARARTLSKMNRQPEAIDLLCDVVEVAPELGYVEWLAQWLDARTLAQMGWDRVMARVVKPLLTWTIRVSVPVRPDDPRQPNLRAIAHLFDLLRAAFPNEKLAHAGLAMARRRTGDVQGALAAAGDGVQRFPQDWGLRTALMNALRDAKRPDEALQQARAAIQLDPQDFSPLHDAAHAYIHAGRPDQAIPLFEELTQRDPRYPNGKAALHYARFLAHHGEEDKQALVTMRDRQPWNDDIASYANEIDPPVAYENVLPGPVDAAYHYGRELVSELGEVISCCGKGATLSVTLQSRYVESPSAFLAFDFAMRSIGAASGALNVEHEAKQNPDPRADKGRVNVPLWRFDGQTVHPCFAQADPRAQQAVAGVAFLPFARASWDPAARRVAEQAGAGSAQALYAVLVNPPAPPREFDPITWVYRCQIATAVILSHLGPWSTGPARAALYSLVSGPSDWATIAGIVALAWRSHDGPEVRPEVEHIFGWLRSLIPAEGFCPWEAALADAWITIGHPDAQRQELERWSARIDQELPEKNSVRTLRRYGGMTLEEYARFSLERDRIQSGLAYPGPTGVMANTFTPPPALVALCQKAKVDPRRPFVGEWQEALNANPALMDRFLDAKRTIELSEMGVSQKEKAALDDIVQGNMDMHQRMAQAQAAQGAVAAGNAGDPDPVVFPGQPVAKLSDYVKIMKTMQTGNMQAALAPYGLTMMTYGAVATAWGAKMAADPVLTEKFGKMMK